MLSMTFIGIIVICCPSFKHKQRKVRNAIRDKTHIDNVTENLKISLFPKENSICLKNLNVTTQGTQNYSKKIYVLSIIINGNLNLYTIKEYHAEGPHKAKNWGCSNSMHILAITADISWDFSTVKQVENMSDSRNLPNYSFLVLSWLLVETL